MSSTEQVCSVTSLLDDLLATNNVTIETAATATNDDNGTVFIVVFGQGLNFTKKMDKGLINNNQCRSLDVQCFNDPTNTKRKLVFYAKNVSLPLYMQGTNCLE